MRRRFQKTPRLLTKVSTLLRSLCQEEAHSMLQSKRCLGCMCEFDLGLAKIQIRTFDEDELARGAYGADGIDSSLVLYKKLSTGISL